MSNSIQCFLLIPTGIKRIALRRYHSSDDFKCAGPYCCHDAMAVIGEQPKALDEPPASDAADPRWPRKCDYCDFVFTPADEFQMFTEEIFKRSDTGAECFLRNVPEGGMYYSPWWSGDNFDHGSIHFKALPLEERRKGHLILKCPGGSWNIDGGSTNGTGWTRSGEAPFITANPSILIYGDDGKTEAFHGWLRNGVLVPC